MQHPNEKNGYGQHTKPWLAQLLKVVKLDYEVISAQGNHMEIRLADGQQKAVTDFVGGYGANLLGHHHSAIAEAVKKYHASGRTSQAQLTARNKSGALCTKICQLAMEETGEEFVAVLANTGAEAVEVALRHARLGWEKRMQRFMEKGQTAFQKAKNQLLQVGSGPNEIMDMTRQQQEWLASLQKQIAWATPIFISLTNAYHGKTQGALGVSGATTDGLQGQVHFLNPGELKTQSLAKWPTLKFEEPVFKSDHLEFYQAEVSKVCGIIAEPLQGEGGVRSLSTVQAKALRQLANYFQCPLIWDEIQSGCYRTGRLFYSSKLGVAGDFYCLGKALGGGEAKISAVLFKRKNYLREFDLLHNSTFAEDDFSAEMGLAFLSQKGALEKKVGALSPLFKEVFEKVKNRYNRVVKECRGDGLLWAVEFHSQDYSGSYVLQCLSRSGQFNYILVGWLLNECGIRCSAPLSQSFVLRFHADVATDENDVEALARGLFRLCEILEKHDLYHLLRFSFPAEWQHLRPRVEDF